MKKTKIEWCDSTLNPVVGCTFGCPYCYARSMNRRFGWVEDFSAPQYFPERLEQLRSRTPKAIFMDSMSDIADWKPEWAAEVFEACKSNPQHKYLFLTKRPERLCQMVNNGELPEGEMFWWGSTITGPGGRRYPGRFLDSTFLSIEPLLEPLNAGLGSFGAARWIIIGAETGNRRGKVTPKREWVENILEAAAITQIPVFMKDSMIPIVGEENMRREFPWGAPENERSTI